MTRLSSCRLRSCSPVSSSSSTSWLTSSMAGLTHASPIVDVAVPLEGRPRRISPGFEAWRKFRRHRMAVASVVILAMLTSAVVLGPFVWRLPINEIDFTARLTSPSWQHPFGTDDLGQDLLARMLYGGRISLAVGFAAMAVAIVAGTLIGAISGISRGSVAGTRRDNAASGDQAYPAQFARTGHRGRHDRRGGGDHRGIDAVVPGPRLSA